MATLAEDQSTHVPLMGSTETEVVEEHENDTHMEHALRRLETFLRLVGFCQGSPLSLMLSWLVFFLLGVVVPLVVIELSDCSQCEKFEIKRFELQILVFESLVAAIALLCISYNLRKYGVRRFLFVDRYHGQMAQFRDEYSKKIHGFFCLLSVWILPCFLVKTAREVLRLVYLHHDSWWLSFAILVSMLVSWTYSTIIYLSPSALFNLVCNLQVILFENYGKLLERDLDVLLCIEEHIRLTHHLSKISHRFRIYLLLEFLVVTIGLFLALVQTTGNQRTINFINSGDFAVCSIVQLAGLIICLHAAAKISHRAQGLGSVASRWHALVTRSSNEASELGLPYNGGNLETGYPAGRLAISYSESDLEPIDYVPVPTNTQVASYMSSFHKRQALGLTSLHIYQFNFILSLCLPTQLRICSHAVVVSLFMDGLLIGYLLTQSSLWSSPWFFLYSEKP